MAKVSLKQKHPKDFWDICVGVAKAWEAGLLPEKRDQSPEYVWPGQKAI